VELLLHRIIVLLTNGTLLFDLLPSRAMLARDIDGICFLPYHLIYHLKRLFNYFLKKLFFIYFVGWPHYNNKKLLILVLIYFI